jgi:glycosyltransferase involved in cell wall biosynthesis
VPAQVEQLMPGRVIYYFCDYWPALPSAYIQRWEAPARRASAGVAKRLIGRVALARLRREPRIALQLERPICVSRAVQRKLVQSNVAVEHGQVVYGGTRLAEAAAARPAREPPSPDRGPRLLYAGRLTPTKGVHVPIIALAELEAESTVTLSVVGGGDPDYTQELRRLARACGVATRVTFRGGASAGEMPAIVSEHDVLVLASDWEAFPRVVLEAMAAGLVVVGTTDGGTGEVLVEGQTGLTFPYGDASALAEQIRRLHNNPSLWYRLAQAGQERVRREFTFSRMVDQFENQLSALDGRRGS